MDERPVVGLLVAAGVVALVTIGVVLRFGLVGPPELAPVDAATRPDAALAVVAFRDREQCLDVVATDGGVREVRCTVDGAGPLIAWDDRGIALVRHGSAGERVEILDPDTGALIATEPFDPSSMMVTRWDDAVDIERSGGALTVRDREGGTLWQVEVSDSYRIDSVERDPRTGTIALLDNAGRLLVLPAGADEPAVWVEDLGVTYGELVWQGTPLDAD